MAKRERKFYITDESGKRIHVWSDQKLHAMNLYEAMGYRVTAPQIRLADHRTGRPPKTPSK